MPANQTTLQLILTRLKESFPSLLLIVSLLCLFSGLVGIIFLQNQGDQQSFDVRQQASEPNDIAMYLESPQANGTLKINSTNPSLITLNLSNEDIDSASIVFFVSSETISNPEIILKNPRFSITSSEIEKNSDGYIVSVELKKDTSELLPTVRQPLLSLQFTGTQTETATISFDADRTTIYKDNQTQKLVADNFRVALQSAQLATDSIPSPTASPINDQVSPRPTPSIRPSPSPSPNSNTVASCNQTCSSNAQCPANHLCYNTGSDRRCRLVTNPSSTSCATPADNGLNRQCNQYCADNRECGSGLSCWFNRCRRPDNIESTSCSRPSATVVQNITQSCNTSCTSNSQCAINMRCYNSQCRLASNPSSTSCSALTSPTVSTTYDTKGGLNASDSATATSSGTVVTPQPSFQPIPSPIVTSPTDENDIGNATTETTNNSFLGRLRQYFTNNTRQLALGLLALGMGILFLFIIVALMRKLRRKPPTPVQAPASNLQVPTVASQESRTIDQEPVSQAPMSIPPHSIPKIDQVHATAIEQSMGNNQPTATTSVPLTTSLPIKSPVAAPLTPSSIGNAEVPIIKPQVSTVPAQGPAQEAPISNFKVPSVAGQGLGTKDQGPVTQAPTFNTKAPSVASQELGTKDQGLSSKDQTVFTTSSGTRINFNKPPAGITSSTSVEVPTSNFKAPSVANQELRPMDQGPIHEVPTPNFKAPSVSSQELGTKDQGQSRSSMLQRIQDKKIALKQSDQ